MTSSSNFRVRNFMRFYVIIASLITMGVGLTVILGWLSGISILKSFLPGLPAMRFNTALSFVLLGGSVWLLQREEATFIKKRVAHILASLVLLLCLLTLSEYMFGWNLGIDEFFVQDLESAPNLFPGRMSPLAILFAGFNSLSLLLLGSKISQYLALTVSVLSFLVLMNTLFGFQAWYVRLETQAVTHTIITYLIVSLAILAARPTHGMVTTLSSNLPGSKALRLLLPILVVLMILMGALVEEGENIGLLNSDQESVLLVILLILVYGPLIYIFAQIINQSEAERSERERQMKALVTSLDDMVFEFDEHGTYLNVWAADESLLAWPKAQLLGKRLGEVIGEQNGRLFSEAILRVMRSGQPENIEYSLKAPGGMRWFNARINPIRDHGATAPTVSMLIRDITERKQSEDRFRLTVESAPNAIVLSDQLGRIVMVNAQTENFFGYGRAELVGLNVDRLVPEQFREIHSSHRQVYLADPQTRRMGAGRDLVGLRKDGSEFPIEIGLTPIATPEGLLVMASIVDIAERKRAEERIARQLNRLNSLRMIDLAISSSFEMQVALEVVLQEVRSQLGVDACAILLFNPQLGKLEHAASRGFRSNALSHTQLRPGEGYAGQAILNQKTIHISNLIEATGGLATAQYLEGEAFIEYCGTPLMAKGEVKGVLELYHRAPLQPAPEWLDFFETLAGQAAIAIDNAQLFETLQRSNAELEGRVAERTAELNQTNIELEHANRAKDEFLANMSHELRTPLNSILGLSESLLEQRRGSVNENQEKFLQMIASSGRHLLDLINDILDLSKIEAGMLEHHPQLISVDEICQSSLSFVRSQATRKSITLSYADEASVPIISADIRQLKQILVNLLTNAVKFTPEGGQVTLQVRADPDKELIQFSIIDTGIGIAPDDLKRLFTPFVQVDSRLNREHEGTGLGLALVQKLTDLHGGSVEVESAVGKGSRFTINLHCKPDVPEQTEAGHPNDLLTAEARTENADLSIGAIPPRKILLAEDNTANILAIGDYLDTHGFEILVAHDGAEAVEKAQETVPDVILMDIQMPVMDGLEATRRLRAIPLFATTPIIALTALAMPGDRERCLEAGATEYMSKPVGLKKLLRTINEMLGRKE